MKNVIMFFQNMFWRYDAENLVYRRDYRIIPFTLVLSIVFSFISYFAGAYWGKEYVQYESEISITERGEEFSKKELIEMLKRLNVKHPHIVLAQSIVETGNWKSVVFKENHNLFGMKEANSRIKTALGTQLNHAYYNNWKESVYDYAFYQARYLSKLTTEAEYYAALDATYAEANNYSGILKTVVEKHNLKSYFK
jgi:uncharacterized FlgJ-related protein